MEKKIKKFKLYFNDLTETAQHYFCVYFKTTKGEEDSREIPIALIERKEED